MRNKSLKRIGILIMLSGILIAIYPLISAVLVEKINEREIKKIENFFVDIKAAETEAIEDKNVKDEIIYETESSQKEEELYFRIDYRKLYTDLYEYNRNLLNKGQVLVDKNDYEIFPINLISYGLDSNLFGYIHIPSINLKLPLYLGTEQNSLNNGAAVMGNTSAPIGGIGTNCVIAAHNGWNGTKRFIKCENLKADDLIYISNIFETLCYRVTDNFVTTDSDTNPVLIIDDEDRITLVTCYPYTGFQTKERLIIRAKRVE